MPPGTLLRVTRGDLDVLVAHTEAGLVAIDDRCPHMGAPLSIGRLDGCVVACPLHRGRFDLATGEVVQFPTTGGLSADGVAHAPWSPPGSPAKPEPSDEKALARALTRVRRLRYYPLRHRRRRHRGGAAGMTGWARRWGPTLACMAVIFLLSSQSGLRASDDAGVDGPLRHLAHVAIYALLSFLLVLAMANGARLTARLMLAAAVLALLYGVTDEFHQTFIRDRTGHAIDLLWDGIGAVVGVVAAAGWQRLRAGRDLRP